jgi:hypothetical protein
MTGAELATPVTLRTRRAWSPTPETPRRPRWLGVLGWYPLTSAPGFESCGIEQRRRPNDRLQLAVGVHDHLRADCVRVRCSVGLEVA